MSFEDDPKKRQIVEKVFAITSISIFIIGVFLDSLVLAVGGSILFTISQSMVSVSRDIAILELSDSKEGDN